MKIQLNGEARDVTEGVTVGELLETLALTGKRVAVEINEEIVPRSLHGETRLSENDRIEVVHAIGGG